jgi:hypothetical protein
MCFSPDNLNTLKLNKNGSYTYTHWSGFSDTVTVLDSGTYVVSDSILTFHAIKKGTEKSYDGNSYRVRKDLAKNYPGDGTGIENNTYRGIIKPGKKNVLILTYIKKN